MAERDSGSAKRDEVIDYYGSGFEVSRLDSAEGKFERERTRILMRRFLPPPPAVVLDIGGGPGGHALWLAGLGYEVHLMDAVPLHVKAAEEASMKQKDAPLAGARVGDARRVEREDGSADAVLLFGPLYHLTDAADRMLALREARRVLSKDSVLMVAGISRFASVLDGIRAGYLKDPAFAKIVEGDLEDGHHVNPTGKPEYFMEGHFHHPDELRRELAGAGFSDVEIYGVEGPGWLLHDFDAWWEDEALRDRLLAIAASVETEPSLLGISAHLIAVGRTGP